MCGPSAGDPGVRDMACCWLLGILIALATSVTNGLARSERPLSSEVAPAKEVRPGDVGGGSACNASVMWGRDLLRLPGHARAVGYSRSPSSASTTTAAPGCTWR